MEKEGGGRSTITRGSVRKADSSMLNPPLCIQSITVIHPSCTPESKQRAKITAANDGTSRNIFFSTAQYLLKKNVRTMLSAEVSTPNFSGMCKFSSEKNLQTCVKVVRYTRNSV